MISFSSLALFTAASLVLLLSPGPNMLFVISHGAALGWRAGLAATLGITTADVILTMLTAMGVSAALAAWPPAFDLIRYLGAVYFLWLAFKTLRSEKQLVHREASHRSLPKIYVRSTLNCLLNPKALLFFMVFLPQFAQPERGPIAMQLLFLGGCLTTVSAVFHFLLGLLSGAARQFLSRQASQRQLSRALAAVFMLLALRLALMSRVA